MSSPVCLSVSFYCKLKINELLIILGVFISRLWKGMPEGGLEDVSASFFRQHPKK